MIWCAAADWSKYVCVIIINSIINFQLPNAVYRNACPSAQEALPPNKLSTSQTNANGTQHSENKLTHTPEKHWDTIGKKETKKCLPNTNTNTNTNTNAQPKARSQKPLNVCTNYFIASSLAQNATQLNWISIDHSWRINEPKLQLMNDFFSYDISKLMQRRRT